MSDELESAAKRIRAMLLRAAGGHPYDLDEHIAMAQARRDVATAHGFTHIADMWHDAALELADVRRMRAKHARDIAASAGPPPPIVRPLTAEELAESRFDDELEDEPEGDQGKPEGPPS